MIIVQWYVIILIRMENIQKVKKVISSLMAIKHISLLSKTGKSWKYCLNSEIYTK